MPITIDRCAELHEAVRAEAPLVQNITNYVAMTISANALLALGASPAMVHAVEEVEDFVAISKALVVNIGTLSPPWVEAMRKAAARADRTGTPWVLDPVGCGATPYRTAVAVELAALRPVVIRGNGSEILSLHGAGGEGPKGVDSTAQSDDALAAARDLSRRTGAIVAVTGATDFVTDGNDVVAVQGGHAWMARSTAFGCALSGIIGAFAAVAGPLDAAVAALAVFGAAGADAADRCNGPGRLPAELCDSLFAMTPDMLTRHASVSNDTVPTDA